MTEEQKDALVASLIDLFFSEKVIPSDKVSSIFNALGYEKETFEEFSEKWEKRNSENARAGESMRDMDMPLILTRGYDPIAPEGELSKYLPEEKILINRDIFRRKLSGVSFTSLTPQTEKSLLDELNNESIGLGAKEVILYYNLLKVAYLSQNVNMSSQTPQQSKNIDFASEIIRLVDENIVHLERMPIFNEGRKVDDKILYSVEQNRIRSGRIKPEAYTIMLGRSSTKYVDFMKEFVSLVSEKWGADTEENIAYLGFYLLLNQADAQGRSALNLSAPMNAFVSDERGRVKPIYYVSIAFVTTFTYVLVTQVYEISRKYKASGSEQQAKIKKLYESEERLQMLLANAIKIASDKIEEYRSESKETMKNIRVMLGKMKSLLKVEDLFSTDYDV